MSYTSKDLIELENKYSANNYHPLDVVINRGEGVWVYDVEGNKYMDFLSGYSALNQGHVNEKILEAAQEQIQKLTLTSRAFRNDQFGLFCQEICELTNYDKVLPMNSGAEAVETALKMARKWGYQKKGISEGKAEIIACAGNFHGRTISIVTFSTEDQYRDGFGPFTDGFKVVEYGSAKAIEDAITENTAAVLVEPIQGEAGIIMPKEGYLTEVAKICKENNVLLMLDEIQTGLGRTGKLFAYEHEKDAKPDVLILGKALSGGFYPVSAVLANEDVMEVFKPGDHGSTFGGNPLAAAIARAALRVLTEDNLVQNAEENGNYLMERLRTIDSKLIKEIRGKGLFIGIELTEGSGGARPFCEALQKEGVLCKETHENVLRLAPPLVITREELDFAFEKLKKILEA